MANYDCLTYFIDQKYKFHLIKPNDFEHLATIVLEYKYKRPFLVYKHGRDGGIDAKASNIGMLQCEKIIVQVKHTRDELETLNDKKRKRVFGKEKAKVEKLVEDNELETYVIFTNYEVPPDQARNLEHYFKEAGAKLVEVIGYEVLCSWVSGSPDLKDALLENYPDISPTPIKSTINKTYFNFVFPNKAGPSLPNRSKSEPDIKGIRSEPTKIFIPV